MRVPPAASLFVVGLLSAGCYVKPVLSESWQLDRLRVLAVKAEPAEPQPGDEVVYSSLVYSPDGAAVPMIWFACLPEGADDFGCEVDPALLDSLEGLDPDSMSEEELAALYAQLVAAGLIGFEPLFSPTWTAPETALDGLDEIAAKEGVSAIVTVQAVPADAVDAEDVEIAYKRTPISLADTPNHNPDFESWTVGGQSMEDGAVVAVAPGEAISIAAVLADDAVEDYDYTNEDGSVEQRTEEPYFTWYTSDGEFDDTTTLYPLNAVRFSAPQTSGRVTVMVTVRDRRGGMGWATLYIDVS